MGDILEILVEEPSMEAFLECFLPTVLPKKFTLGENCRIHPHQGKADLQQSIPKKVQAYRGYKNDYVHILILHDQDLADCKKLKEKLKKLVDNNVNENQRLAYKITIVCRELENWHCGDLEAVEKVISQFKARKYENTSKFRNVDAIHVSKDAHLKTLVEKHGKINLAREMGTHLNKDRNTSQSFKNFIENIENLGI